jgi:formylglycine-generating enzyme required for sulfatase activity
MDVDDIHIGFNFVEVIQNAVGSCVVLLAVIGRQWLTSTDSQGQRRLDNPEDFVRLEITTALQRKIRVIPVLVDGASMPRSTELPDVLQPLANLHALVVGDRFHPDVNRLIEEIETVLGATSSSISEGQILRRLLRFLQSKRLSVRTKVDTSEPTPMRPSFTNSIGMEFVLIPAGTFTMGSPDSDVEAQPNEKPAHRVTISQPFYLGRYPVTQAQWETVMENNPSHFSDQPNQPVERVSWKDMHAFLHKLNEREAGGDYRLPTEAQWEYACRAGTETPRYHHDVTAIAWYWENSNRQPQPVGQKLPNAWGLYDMLGNVREWCRDGRRTYTEDAVVDPIGLTGAGVERAIRGGSWNNTAEYVRAAERNWGSPDYRFDFRGFRCASSGRRG